jgi:Holliday junction DNA helicase RuvA
MITHLRGNLTEIAPTYAIVECGGVGYYLHISLNTYSKIKDQKELLIHTQFVVREDAHLLFGFSDKQERDMFLMLTSVSGIGAATARMILSAMTSQETAQAIVNGDVRRFKSVKGVGEKSAQRIIVDLKDKAGSVSTVIPAGSAAAPVTEEALAALLALGFARPAAEKAVSRSLHDLSGAPGSVETLIKTCLKYL